MKRNIVICICLFALILSCNDAKQKPEVKTKSKTENLIESMAIHTISNDNLKVSIKTKGAELTSIKVDTTEYLWQGNPEFWNRQSPILFPIVGRLKDHEYTYNGKTYKMPQHGFARDNEFHVVAKSKNSITFEQIATETSKAIYPFDFVLQIQYVIHDKTLAVNYLVKNPSAKDDLYFSIGAHPAFNCPIEKGQKRSEYQLVFDTDAMPKTQDKDDGLYKDQWTQYFKEPGILELPNTVFDEGSLTFNPNPFSKVTFVHKPTNKQYLSVTFKDFPYLGIWSINNKSPFVCIEPWFGIADHVNHNKDYKRKEGVLKLAPNKTFTSSYTIEIL
ncbi:aldose 1-epimerase family protein [Lacinutrix chionoecetis]